LFQRQKLTMTSQHRNKLSRSQATGIVRDERGNFLQLFEMRFSTYLVLAHLFVNVPVPWTRDSEGTFSVFELSYHLLLPVWPPTGRGKCLGQRHYKPNLPACSPYYPCIAER